MTPAVQHERAATSLGAVTGTPRLLLRAEALLGLALLLVAYGALGASWTRFALLFLAPDLSFVAYLAGPRVGAWTYDAAHSLIGPGALVAGSSLAPTLLPLAVLWAAHIAFDRALGYGLKYETGFRHTHLGTVGAPRSPARNDAETKVA
ncbi:MAG: DUF4260 domain-containing protein [Myxococcota bacterium]